jgi:hypothetical protein
MRPDQLPPARVTAVISRHLDTLTATARVEPG